MSASLILLVVVSAIVAFALVAIAGIYNRLVVLRNRFRNAFAQIDVQLKRRHDLIPNLVEAVKGYMQHERETLTAVIEARNQARQAEQQAAGQVGEAAAMQQLSVAERMLGGALGRMLALVDSYPDLKANQNTLQLQEELGSTENKIAFARQAYNDAVMVYNTQLETFPTVLLAGLFGFRRAELFAVQSPDERVSPVVSF